MKNSKKYLSYLAQVALMIGVYIIAEQYQTRNMLAVEQNIPTAMPQLVSLSGEVQSITHPDKRTLVYFFAPWCRVCALSIGSLNAIQNDDLHVVAVALDYDNVEAVQHFVTEHNLEQPVLLGNTSVREAYRVKGYPSYYLINEQGEIVAKSFGFNTSIGIKLRNWLSS